MKQQNKRKTASFFYSKSYTVKQADKKLTMETNFEPMPPIHTDLEKRLESELKELEAERAQLRQKTEQQKMVIQRFQQEEQHRRTQLKDALNTYFNAPPTLTDVI